MVRALLARARGEGSGSNRYADSGSDRTGDIRTGHAARSVSTDGQSGQDRNVNASPAGGLEGAAQTMRTRRILPLARGITNDIPPILR